MSERPPIPSPRPSMASLPVYVPGEQMQRPGLVKLNTNEFPYGPPPEVGEAIARATTEAHRYPDPTARPLRRRLAEHHGVAPEQVFVGNGSDEVLRLLAQAWLEPGRRMAMVQPTYSLFEVLAAQCGASATVYPLEDGKYLPEALLREPWDVCFLPVPNPPLGTVFAPDELARVAARPGLLVLDEAYIEFADPATAAAHAALARAHPNIVRTRTFSKSHGLAGMRVGYAIAHPAVIDVLDRLRDSYNVNRASQAAAMAALEADAYYLPRREAIVAERARLTSELERRGWRVHRSWGNFVFARRADARSVFEGLRARGVLVRYFDQPGLRDGIRITIGTPEECRALIETLDSLS